MKSSDPLYKTYVAWKSMKSRCLIPSATGYKNYGGRGIIICNSWMSSFNSFFSDMGKCPDGYSLDRIDVNGHYEPMNCRWAAKSVQSRNTRRNVYLEVNGVTMTVKDWSNHFGFSKSLIRDRLKLGWSVKDAVMTPVWASKRPRATRKTCHPLEKGM